MSLTDERLAYHVAEPTELRIKREFWKIGVPNSKGIAFVFGDDESNARRLVSCWNACIGLSTTFIEQESLQTALRLIVSTNAELMAAVRDVMADERVTVANGQRITDILTRLGGMHA